MNIAKVHPPRARKAATGAPVEKNGKNQDQLIYDKIFRAILEQRLLAGTKLGEEALSAALHVSRATIRRILLSLANRNVVELKPNKGAFVATPDQRQARHVFEARRTIESTIIKRVVERIDAAKAASLQNIIDEELRYQRLGSRHDAIRLSGQFHLRLAEISENLVLLHFLEELISRTSLIIGMFGTSTDLACSEGVHSTILAAIISGDAAVAQQLMDEHLQQIEVSIRLPEEKVGEVDFKTLFAGL